MKITFNADHAIALSTINAAYHTALYAAGIDDSCRVLCIGKIRPEVLAVFKILGAEMITPDNPALSVYTTSSIILTRNPKNENFKELEQLSKTCKKHNILLIEDFSFLIDSIDFKNPPKAPEYGDVAIIDFANSQTIQSPGAILLFNSSHICIRSIQTALPPERQKTRLIKFKIREINESSFDYQLSCMDSIMLYAVLNSKVVKNNKYYSHQPNNQGPNIITN